MNIETKATLKAAHQASINAQQEAKKVTIPIFYKNGNVIYAEYPDGTKKTIKTIKEHHCFLASLQETINLITNNKNN